MKRSDNFKEGKQVTSAGRAEAAWQDTEKTVQEKQEQHKEIMKQLLGELGLEEGETIEFPYLVRGAQLCCTCGTHKRKLNLPLCHGVYIENNPAVHEEDCKVGDDGNIAAFGICESEGHPAKRPWWVKAPAQEEEYKKILLVAEDGSGNVKGYACTPCIVGAWKDVHETQKIARNHTDGTAEGDKLSALTLESFLVCAYGGLIQPVTSGQDEEE